MTDNLDYNLTIDTFIELVTVLLVGVHLDPVCLWTARVLGAGVGGQQGHQEKC